MIPYSPAFTLCVPRLFRIGTPGGNQSNGASRSSPAEVQNTIFNRGAVKGVKLASAAVCEINTSISGAAAAKASAVSPKLTTCPPGASPARAAAAAHSSGVNGKFWALR